MQGSVVRDLSSATSYNGPITLGSDSTALIRLFGSHDDVRGEGMIYLITEQLIAPAPDFPIAFCLTGSLAVAATYRQLILQAEVRQHSSIYTVGDTFNESLYLVTAPNRDQDIQVFGLESCSSPGAGGNCLGLCMQ